MIMGWKSGRQDGIILATFNSEEDCDVELDRLTKELKAVIVQEV
jgi:hypothetical protein